MTEEERIKRKKESVKKYCLLHPDRVRDSSKKWKKANPDYQNKWWMARRDKVVIVNGERKTHGEIAHIYNNVYLNQQIFFFSDFKINFNLFRRESRISR